MPPPPAKRRAAQTRRHRHHAVKRRRLAAVVALAIVAVGTLLVTAFGGGTHSSTTITAPVSSARLLPGGPPATLVAVARLGTLTIHLPVNEGRLTAIGFHSVSDGALGLTPIGTQVNQGLLKRLAHAVVGGGSASPRWYLLPGGQGPTTSALDVGAAPGTDVYAPISGTIVGIEKVILNGKAYGRRIDIQPDKAPSLVVSVANLAADPYLTVGASVRVGSSKLGTLIDLSGVETQTLARYTNDAGNHVLVEVRTAATLGIR